MSKLKNTRLAYVALKRRLMRAKTRSSRDAEGRATRPDIHGDHPPTGPSLDATLGDVWPGAPTTEN